MNESTVVKPPERARIVSVTARNVKCLREVFIEPGQGVTSIEGTSGQGKSAFLLAIEGCLNGFEPGVVRHGEEAGSVELHLTNALIERIFHADPTVKDQVTVSTPEGMPIKQAKNFLAAIAGPTAFQPIEWVLQGGGPAKGKTERLRLQRNQLLDAMPVKLTLKQVRDAAFQLGPEIADALNRIQIDHVDFKQHALVVCGELKDQAYEFRKGYNDAVETAKRRLQDAAPPSRQQREPLGELQDLAERKEDVLRTARAKIEVTGLQRERLETLRGEIEQGEKTVATLSAIDEQMASLRDNFQTLEKEEADLVKQLVDCRKSKEASRELLGELHGKRVQRQGLNSKREEALAIEQRLRTAPENTELLEENLKQAQFDVADRLKQRERLEAQQECDAKQKLASELDQLVRMFRDELPAMIIGTMEMPVDGLSIEGGVVARHGTPLHLLGTSEQIEVGVRVAATLNPFVGFILVDRAESLGPRELDALRRVTAELQLQMVMTKLNPDAIPGPDRIVMQEGQARKTAAEML